MSVSRMRLPILGTASADHTAIIWGMHSGQVCSIFKIILSNNLVIFLQFSNKTVCLTKTFSRHYCNIRVTQVVLTPCAFIPAKNWYWQPQEMEPLTYGNVRFTLPMRVPRVEWPHPRTNLIPWRGRAAKLLVRYYYLFERFFFATKLCFFSVSVEVRFEFWQVNTLCWHIQFICRLEANHS